MENTPVAGANRVVAVRFDEADTDREGDLGDGCNKPLNKHTDAGGCSRFTATNLVSAMSLDEIRYT